MKRLSNKRSKSCEISQKVKQHVFERDNGCCVVCGNSYNVMPNAHYIPRSKGGLGIEENVVTLCTGLTKNNCHHKFDNGTKTEKENIKQKIKKYLMSIYPEWDEEKLIYKK